MKRILDIFSAIVLMVLLSPILLLSSIAIALTSEGPILFKQTRIGQNKTPFTLYKLRSMVVEGQATGHGKILEGQSLVAARNAFKTTRQGDPRITPLGRILRKFYLDELPQLWNIVIGDMSLIGPRPDVPAQEADYTAQQWLKRHRLKPGITGLAQVYQKAPGYHHYTRIGLDLKYIQKQDLCLDMKILLLTLLNIVRGGSF